MIDRERIEVIDKEIENDIQYRAFHQFVCGKNCVNCGQPATQLRIDYQHLFESRDQSMIYFLIKQWSEEKQLFKNTKKINPYCFSCKIKQEKENISDNICISYIFADEDRGLLK